jgi:hypothetical protein
LVTRITRQNTVAALGRASRARFNGVKCIKMTQTLRKLVLSAVVGFLYFYAVKVFWGYFPNVNPLTNWLFSCCAASSWVIPVIHLHDIIINILLCIPLAIFLIKLRAKQLWLLVIAALVPNFIYGYYHLLQPEYSGWNVSDFTFGISIDLLCLPLATLLIFFLTKREHT